MNQHNNTPVSEYTLLVVNPKGQLRVLYCPLRVICKEQVGTIKAGTSVWVERVLSAPSPNGQLLYQILGKLYLYKQFGIQVKF